MNFNLIREMIKTGEYLTKGAESTLYKVSFLGIDAILKYRNKKLYRIEELDRKIRGKRTFTEASLLYEASKYNINVPRVLYINIKENAIILEYIKGKLFRELLLDNALRKREIEEISRKIGKMISNLHNLKTI